MRTTLKRGVGRGASFDADGGGNGRAVFPPGAASAISRYRQPPPSRRSGFGIFGRILIGTLLAIVSCAVAIAGGAYLYFHHSVEAVQASTPDVLRAQKALHIAKANAPAIALVLGYDHRAGIEADRPSLSDTLMLIRADPATKTISLLSLPRDLDVPIYCTANGPPVEPVDRINSAYSRCGSKGSVITIEKYTGLPINYLITVNFHGFKEVVDKLHGVWMDIDRRYYNKNTGAAYDDYANIDLEPGYQKLDGEQALDFVRFRHTDSDLTRVVRQQEFVRALRDQIKQNFSIFDVPQLINAITSNIQVAEGGHKLTDSEVEKYAFFAYGLPSGHVLQVTIPNVVCSLGCQATPQDIQTAVQQFTNPDVGAANVANDVALGHKPKQKTPPPSSVTVTVLNGSTVVGAAANASYLLGQHGYKVLTPPNNLAPNLEPQTYFHSKVYYDPAQKGSKAAALALRNLIQPAEVAPLPRRHALLALDPGAMDVVVLGSAFSGSIAPVTTQSAPTFTPPTVRTDPAVADQLLQPLAHRVPFRLMVPTVLEESSYPDTLPGDVPVRLYTIQGHHKAVRLVFRTGGGTFWGVEETDWDGAPVLSDRSFEHRLGHRDFDMYYSGPHLQMIVLHEGGATYWVVNTLLDDLSNETMIAIAKGLKPLAAAK